MPSDNLHAGDTEKDPGPSVVLLRLAEIADQFSKIENISYDCSVPDTVYFLCRAKTALSSAKKKSEPR